MQPNALEIVAKCRRIARAIGYTQDQWIEIRTEMLSGDYDQVLKVARERFGLEYEDDYDQALTVARERFGLEYEDEYEDDDE